MRALVNLTEQRLGEVLERLSACESKSKQFMRLFKKHGFEKAYELVTDAAFNEQYEGHYIGQIFWVTGDIRDILYRAMTRHLDWNTRKTRPAATVWSQKAWDKLMAYSYSTSFRRAFPAKRVERILLRVLKEKK